MTKLAVYVPDEPIEVYLSDDDFMEEMALAVLLIEEQVFVNGFVRHDGSDSEEVRLFVLCNDIFAWGMADLEPFTLGDIQDIYDAYAADPTWGTAKWCCVRRNEQPQRPVARDMKRDGSWDDTMEKLPENRYDKAWRERKEKG